MSKGVKLPKVGEDPQSKAFFAALLSAAMGKCDCEACTILRGVAGGLKDEFMPKVKGVVRAAQTDG
jgi:hypothetical protein